MSCVASPKYFRIRPVGRFRHRRDAPGLFGDTCMKTPGHVWERAVTARVSKGAIARYGFAVASVVVAVAAGYLLNYLGLDETVFAVFMFAIAATSWFSGNLPAIVAFVLSALSFNFFFTPPPYRVDFTRTDFAYSSAFLVFAGLAIASDT